MTGRRGGLEMDQSEQLQMSSRLACMWRRALRYLPVFDAGIAVPPGCGPPRVEGLRAMHLPCLHWSRSTVGRWRCVVVVVVAERWQIAGKNTPLWVVCLAW